ncbi:MAG: hypothetical protein JW384_02282 [Nitrosomonadaceae bacterium]|nr:hypothetical protein [Nitrosomonadaceae bacterium]
MSFDVTQFGAPTAETPTWVRLLMMITGRLPNIQLSDGIGARAVVAAPTTRHIAAAAAICAVQLPDFDAPSPAHPGVRVATVLSQEFQDADVVGIGERYGIGGTQFALPRIPPAAIIGLDWDLDRRAQLVPDEALSIVKPWYNEPQSWIYQRLCLHPVVVISNRPSLITQDLADLAKVSSWWNPLQHVAMVGPKDGIDQVFRRPVVVASPTALLASQWMREVKPALVVVVGFAVWTSSARHLWQGTSQLLVLNQRSGDVAQFREWFDGTTFPEVNLPTIKNLRRAGITATVFGEPIIEVDFSISEEDQEWEF